MFRASADLRFHRTWIAIRRIKHVKTRRSTQVLFKAYNREGVTFSRPIITVLELYTRILVRTWCTYHDAGDKQEGDW
jgi:hypothetical protein